MISVLIAIQTPLLRLGIQTLLTAARDICIVGEASTSKDLSLFDRVAKTKPDVVLLDGTFCEGESGVCEERLSLVAHKITVQNLVSLRQTGARHIFVLTGHPNEEDLFSCMVEGVEAYESAHLSGEDLLMKLQLVAKGLHLINECVLTYTLIADAYEATKQKARQEWQEWQTTSTQEGRAGKRQREATAREVDVLKLIIRDKTTAQMAKILYLSEQTVKNYLSSLFVKFGVRDRTGILVEGLKRGVITLSDIHQAFEEEDAQRTESCCAAMR